MINKLNEICPLYTNGTSKRKIRHNFFKSIETEIQAYLLGFIMADGSVNEKRHTLTININKKDAELFKLFNIISPDAYIHEEKNYESKATVRGKTVKNSGSLRLCISSIVLIEDLKKLGVVENKTYSQLNIPNIPDNLIKHFIRGYFDGDGCITYSVIKPNPDNREKNYRVSARFEICSKTNNLLLEFQKWFANKDVELGINYIKRDDMYNLQVCSRNKLIDIFSLLYSESKYYLSRKYEKFNYYVNTEVSQLIADHRNAQIVSDKRAIIYPRVRNTL